MVVSSTQLLFRKLARESRTAPRGAVTARFKRKRVQTAAMRMAIRRGISRRGIRTEAGITTPGKAIVAAIVRTPLARSVLRKIPGVSRFIPGSPARIQRAEAMLRMQSARGIAQPPGTSLATRAAPIAKRAGQIGAVGAAFAVGEEIVSRTLGSAFGGNQGRGTSPRRKPVARAQQLAVGSEIPPSHQVVRTWQTFPGGPIFARLADGHIAVQKKDGTIKHFRPYRPVVIPRKWNARSMSRVATALKRQRRTATKIMQITGGMPKGRK